MDGLIIPGIFIALAMIPLGIEIFDNDDNNDGDDNSDAGGTETSDDPVEIVNEGTADEYAILSDNNAGRLVEDGTGGNDLFFGGAGNDILDGLDGDDLVVGGSGKDLLSGSAGNDVLVSADLFTADFTNASLEASVEANATDSPLGLDIFKNTATLNATGPDLSEADRVNGGDGDDTIIFGHDDIIVGGAGADSYIGVESQLSADNPALIRQMSVDDELVLAYKTDPNSTLSVEDQAPEITLQNNADGSATILVDGETLINIDALPEGFSVADVKLKPFETAIADLAETAGTETIDDPITIVNEGTTNEYAILADDNAGRQVEDGTNGNDVFFGGANDDYLSGINGNDLIDGGSGDDQLLGGDGADVLIGADMFATDFTTADLQAAVADNSGGTILDLSIFNDAANLNMTGTDMSGADKLNGGEGEDIIFFGQGDGVVGGDAADTYVAVTSHLSADNPAVIRQVSVDDTLVLAYPTDPDSTLSVEEQAPKIAVRTNADGSATVLVNDAAVINVTKPDENFIADNIVVKPFGAPVADLLMQDMA